MSSEPTEPTKDEDSPKEAGKGASHNRRATAATLIDAFAQQYQADRKEVGRREGHRIFREWLTIVGLFIAAIVAALPGPPTLECLCCPTGKSLLLFRICVKP
jgi:hypothetical protein